MLKLSVVMAVYNGEKYITEQLLSLFHQLRRPDEVIICDDCSTDSTVQTAKCFIEENRPEGWRVVENNENLGFIGNFRRALSLAEGDIVFLCDQDDIWYPDKLEALANVFNSRSGVLAVSTAFDIIDASGAKLSRGEARGTNNGLIARRLGPGLHKIGLDTVLRCNISPGCTSAVRRELVCAYVNNTEGELPHDYELNVIAAAKNGLYFLNAPLVGYRIHGGNALGLDAKLQSRAEIAAEKLKAASAVFSCTGDGSVYKALQKRLSLLESGSAAELLQLNLNSRYRRLYTLKERAGDLLYVTRRQK